MRRSLLFCTTAALVLLSAPSVQLHAQELIQALAADSLGERPFLDMESAFLRWSQEHDLTKTKGWKWYARWEWFNRTRLGGDGSIADQRIYWQEASAVSERKQSRSTMSLSGGWSPVGPRAVSDSSQTQLAKGLGRINCVTFHPTDPKTFWVGVAQGGVWKTINGGESWRPLTDELPILRISDIAVDPRHPDTLYISVGDYAYIALDLIHAGVKRSTHYGMGVFKSTDGGESWAQTGLGFKQTDQDGSLIRRVFVDNTESSRLVAVGIGGAWTSEDGGTTWKRSSQELFYDIERDPATPTTLYASTGYVPLLGRGTGGLVKSEDFGKTWTTMPTAIPPYGVQRIELAISPSDPRTVYALAAGLDAGFHSLHRTTDGGATWEERVRRGVDPVPNILSSGTGSGTGGQGSYNLTILVDPNDPERITTGGINLWGSSNGGKTWGPVSYWVEEFGPSVHADQHFLAYNRLDDRFFICNDGGIYATDSIVIANWHDAIGTPGFRWPTVWTNLTQGMEITSFYRIGLSRNNPGTIMAGAQDNATFYRQNDSWINIFGGDGMDCLIHPDDPRTIYGSSQYGLLVKSVNGGEESTVSYDLTKEIKEVVGEKGEWTTPMAMHPTNPQVIYAAYGNLYRSTDGGSSWNEMSAFPPMPGTTYPTPASAMSIVSGHPEHIYLAKRVYHQYNQPTALWRTADDGASWQNITAGLPSMLYLTSIATSDIDPDRAWVTFGGFTEGQKIFRTTNGGGTWENISQGLPNLPANSVVYEPGSENNQIYLGTDAGVYYTNDGMEGWSLYSENLPNVIISELEIDPIGRKLYAATFGRGVWMSDLASGIGRASDASRHMVDATVVAAGDGIVVTAESAEPVRSSALEIVDIRGAVVHSGRIEFSDRRYREQIRLPLPYGLYFARLIVNGRTSVVKFVVE